MAGVSFVLELVDQITKTTKRATAGVKKIETASKAASVALDALDSGGARKLTGELAKASSQANTLANSIEHISGKKAALNKAGNWYNKANGQGIGKDVVGIALMRMGILKAKEVFGKLAERFPWLARMANSQFFQKMVGFARTHAGKIVAVMVAALGTKLGAMLAARLGGALKNGLSGLAGAVGGKLKAMAAIGVKAFAAIGVAAAAAGAVVVGLMVKAGISLAKYASAVQARHNQLRTAFKVMTGSQAAGDALLEEINKRAAHLGVSTNKFASTVRKLISGGMGKKDALNMASAFKDLEATTGESTEGLDDAIAKMMGRGKLSLEVLEPILNRGLDDPKFFAALKKASGFKGDQAAMTKAISAGKFSSEEGLAALIEAIEKQTGGKAGSMAHFKSMTTLSGVMSRVGRAWEQTVKKINGSKASKEILAFGNAIANALEPNGSIGRELIYIFDTIMSNVGNALAAMRKFASSSVFTTLRTAFVYVAAAAIIAGVGFKMGFVLAAKAAGSAITWVSTKIGALMNWLGLSGSVLAGLLPSWRTVAQVVLYAAVGFGVLAAVIGTVLGVLFLLGVAFVMVPALILVAAIMAVSAVVGWLIMMREKIVAAATEFYESAKNMATNIVNGLVEGITSGAGRFVEAIKALAMGGVNAFKGAMRIASPSKVFEELGGYTAEGLEVGLDGGRGGVDDSAGNLLDVPSRKAAFTAGQDAGAGGAAGGNTFNLNITGGDPFEVARQVREQLEEILGGAVPQGAS